MAKEMNQTSAQFGPDSSEWEYTEFTKAESILVKPPRVLESPAQLECRVFAIIPHGSGQGSANYVIGEVLMLHLAGSPESIGDFRMIGRMGGSWYIDTFQQELFELERPSSKVSRH